MTRNLQLQAKEDGLMMQCAMMLIVVSQRTLSISTFHFHTTVKQKGFLHLDSFVSPSTCKDLESVDDDCGLFVSLGQSGAGKTSSLRRFGPIDPKLTWDSRTSIMSLKNFADEKIAIDALQSIGFNTVPSWFKAYPILSQGEKYRAKLARLHCRHGKSLL